MWAYSMLRTQRETGGGWTNACVTGRQKILERCYHANVDVLFIESICDDPILLSKNYEMKLSNSGSISRIHMRA